MSVWSEHFENRDAAVRPWCGDIWSNGSRTLKIVGALFAKDGTASLVVFDDDTVGRVGCAGGTWKRELKGFSLTRRIEDGFSPETVEELKRMPVPEKIT